MSLYFCETYSTLPSLLGFLFTPNLVRHYLASGLRHTKTKDTVALNCVLYFWSPSSHYNRLNSMH